MKPIKRSTGSKIIRVFEDGIIKEVRLEIILRKLKVDGLIRFWKEDFIRIRGPSLMHFNLQVCYHVPGRIYSLVVIRKGGYYNGIVEVLPVLDFSDSHRALCLEVRENVSYGSLNDEDFRDSLDNIKTVDELKDAILRRYTRSMPEPSADEIISMGVSMTRLRILD